MFRRVFITFVLLSTLLASAHSVCAKDTLSGLDDTFQEFNFRLYDKLLKQKNLSQLKNMGALAKRVNTLAKTDPVQATALIIANHNLLQENYRSAHFAPLLAVLYANNATATIRDITQYLNKNANRLGRSVNYFLLAKYYNARGNWKGVNAALAQVDVKHLQEGDNDFYYVMQGYALQGAKSHRKALEQYKLIPEDSPYYHHAQLNLGTAMLKQGWWTDAHAAFNQAIDHKSKYKEAEFDDRTLTVLGYSQLHHEFYRDAVRTFSKVGLKSRHVNKALMGMGLCAAYQKDFNKAKNAFTLLSNKTPKDHNVDEAYILLPFAYEEMKKGKKATEAYRLAVAYFQKRLQAIELAQAKLLASRDAGIPPILAELEGQATELYGKPQLIPDYFLQNYALLRKMNTAASETGLHKPYRNLVSDYEVALKKQVNRNLTARREMLNSYLSQAKFGVAKLYDK